MSDRDFENMGRQRGEWQREWLQQTPTGPRDERLAGAVACPFCGSRNLSLPRLANFVHCDGCGADGPEVPVQRHDISGREALARWECARMKPRRCWFKHDWSELVDIRELAARMIERLLHDAETGRCQVCDAMTCKNEEPHAVDCEAQCILRGLRSS
jgi:hypothetical protein